MDPNDTSTAPYLQVAQGVYCFGAHPEPPHSSPSHSKPFDNPLRSPNRSPDPSTAQVISELAKPGART